MDSSRVRLPKIFSKVVVKETGEVGVFHGTGFWGRWKVKLIGKGSGQSLWRCYDPEDVTIPLSDLAIQRKKKLSRRALGEL